MTGGFGVVPTILLSVRKARDLNHGFVKLVLELPSLRRFFEAGLPRARNKAPSVVARFGAIPRVL